MPSISEWIDFEKYIDSEIERASLEEGKNIKGLECSISGNRITYSPSPFEDALSDKIRGMFRSPIIIRGIRGKMNTQSLTSIFSDDKSFFLEKLNIINLFKLLYSEKIENILSEESKMYVDSLFNGEKNESIVNNLNEECITDFLETKKESFLQLIEKAHMKPTLYLDLIINSLTSLTHTLACICSFKDDTFNIYIYDPMYFYRDKSSYEIALGCAYIYYYLMSKYTNIPVKLINLSALCPETPKGKHCVQYQINAEYCPMYCTYFLYLYAKNDYPTERDKLQDVINKTFIVPPLKLERKVCIETNIFKIKMMSFMLHVCILYSKDFFKEWYPTFIEIAKKLSEQTGIQLVSFPLEGGRRSHKRQTKKYRRVGLKSRRKSRKFFV